MKQILIIAIAFVVFTGNIAAQEQERVVDNSEIQMFLELSENIQSGEISFVVNEVQKGKSTVKTKEYKAIFFKTGEINYSYYPYLIFHYNLLDVTDSIQYIYNGKIWYIIDHKKKICDIDTNYCKIACEYPFIYPIVLVNELLCFYIRDDLRGSFLRATTIEEVQKTDNTTFVKIETSRLSPNDGRKNKEVLFTEAYEWNISKSILLRYSKAVKDDKGYSPKTVIKTETLLTDASLNDEKYADAALYNGLNYAESYKIKHGDYKKKR